MPSSSAVLLTFERVDLPMPAWHSDGEGFTGHERLPEISRQATTQASASTLHALWAAFAEYSANVELRQHKQGGSLCSRTDLDDGINGSVRLMPVCVLRARSLVALCVYLWDVRAPPFSLIRVSLLKRSSRRGNWHTPTAPEAAVLSCGLTLVASNTETGQRLLYPAC